MKISMIVAKSKNNVIGIKNTLPWKLSEDLSLFKEKTLNKYILMGTNTFYSIGKKLPNRISVILTQDKELKIEDCIIINNFEDIYSLNTEEIIIIGGASIYSQFLNKVNHKLYISEVDCDIDGDAFFPELNLNDWEESNRTSFLKNERNDFDFEFIEYTKKGS